MRLLHLRFPDARQHGFILIWILTYNVRVGYLFLCESAENNGCCDGYFLNFDSKKCEKCMAGYIGPNCTIRCPYPTYGELCQGNCDCNKNSCDVSTGCRTWTTTKLQEECSPGYFGHHCRAKCMCPYYGVDCESQCNCSEHQCNATTGCSTSTVDHDFIHI
ncbi:uncharacterized protein LOC144625834 isoform X2 [Crassostrea virginica]